LLFAGRGEGDIHGEKGGMEAEAERTSPAGLASTRSRRLSATGDLRDYATRLAMHVDTSLCRYILYVHIKLALFLGN
jgi:hypothetical protein